MSGGEEQVRAAGATAGPGLLRRVIRVPELMVLVAILVVVVGFVIMAPSTFLSARSIGAFMTAAAQLGVVAVGAAILIIAGEFDISVGSNYAFSGIVIGLLSTAGLPMWLAILIGLVVATSIGLSNGLITLAARIPSFITTLGTWLVWFGLTLAVSKGFFVRVKPNDGLIQVIGGLVGYQFYASIFWWLGIGVIAIILLGRTPLGNWIFAAGGNAEAARAVGVPGEAVRLRADRLPGGSLLPLYPRPAGLDGPPVRAEPRAAGDRRGRHRRLFPFRRLGQRHRRNAWCRSDVDDQRRSDSRRGADILVPDLRRSHRHRGGGDQHVHFPARRADEVEAAWQNRTAFGWKCGISPSASARWWRWTT
jgi:hypothetical protein